METVVFLAKTNRVFFLRHLTCPKTAHFSFLLAFSQLPPELLKKTCCFLNQAGVTGVEESVSHGADLVHFEPRRCGRGYRPWRRWRLEAPSGFGGSETWFCLQCDFFNVSLTKRPFRHYVHGFFL